MPTLERDGKLYRVRSQLLCDDRTPQQVGEPTAWEMEPVTIDAVLKARQKGLLEAETEGHLRTLTNTIAPAVGELGWRGPKGPYAGNLSGFRATGHRVLLLADPVEEKTSGGIILQSKTVQAEENLAVWATVVEVGHDAWADKSTDYCQVGDRVLIGQYVGKFHDSPVDKRRYRFVNDLDIITPLVKVPAQD
jgi:co-chaperonin GroES (HSP10)